MEREKVLSVCLELPNDARVQLNRLKPETKVATVKIRIEQEAGILPHTYQLTYLDAAPLEDHKTLADLDVVPGATLRLVVWRLWQGTLVATLRGDIQQCVTELQALGEKGDSQWKNYCRWCTLYTAAHYGHYVLTSTLLRDSTVPVNFQSLCGWTALHATAKMGRWKALCVLIDNGADVKITDKRGRTALDLAHDNGHKKCEQSLSFCEWNLQKHSIVEQRKLEHDAGKERDAGTRQAHQYADSKLTMWRKGPQGQMYMTHAPNPVSVQKVARCKAKSSQVTGTGQPSTTLKKRDDKVVVVEGTKGKFDYSWFDPLRAQQLVPSTHHILTYSNPSSSHLQPRSLLNPEGYTQFPK